MNKRNWILVVTLLATAVTSGGCFGGATADVKLDPNAGKSKSQRMQDDIAAIKANPNMPESAKQQAIAAMQGSGHQAGGQ